MVCEQGQRCRQDIYALIRANQAVLPTQAIALATLDKAQAQAQTESITNAQYTTPVTRYGHFALGTPHEYARLSITAETGRKLELQLPEAQVFEDLKLRLVRLAAGEPAKVLAIVSRRADGSRLVMLRMGEGGLNISAESPATGTPNRWGRRTWKGMGALRLRR